MSRRRRQTGDRCHRKDCRSLLEFITVDGVLEATCRPCARIARGLCCDCPARLPVLGPRGRGRRRRCDRCRLKHLRELKKAAYRADPDHFRELKRKSSRRPHVRERQRRYQKAWQAKQPKVNDHFSRLYAREWQRRWRSDPAVRDRVNARRRELARQKRAEVVARGEHKRLYPAPFGPRRHAA